MNSRLKEGFTPQHLETSSIQ